MTTEVPPAVDQNSTQKPLTQKQLSNMPSMTISSSWHPSSKHEKEASQTKPADGNQVLSDPNIKFPLENSWSFHFYKNEKTKTWKENVKFITTVDFVEDFWGYIYVLIIFYYDINT